MRTLKVLVIGLSGAGKTTLICTGESDYVSGIGTIPPSKFDICRVPVNDNLMAYYFGITQRFQYHRFNWQWQIMTEGVNGLIAVVDSTHPETFREARALLTLASCYAPVPRVIVASKQDLPNAVPVTDSRFLQAKMHLSDKIIPRVATDQDSARKVLSELLPLILSSEDLQQMDKA